MATGSLNGSTDRGTAWHDAASLPDRFRAMLPGDARIGLMVAPMPALRDIDGASVCAVLPDLVGQSIRAIGSRHGSILVHHEQCCHAHRFVIADDGAPDGRTRQQDPVLQAACDSLRALGGKVDIDVPDDGIGARICVTFPHA